MRILHAIRSDGFAGVERHVAILAGGQARLGHEVVVIGGDPDAMTRGVPEEVALSGARTTLDVVRAVHRWHRTFRPDVVHAHMTAAEVGAASGLGLHPTPLVATLHFARTRGSNPFSALSARALARRLRGQIAVSRYVAAHAGGASTVIYPGVATCADPPSSADRDPVVLVAQRLEAEKETAIAVEAFAEAGLGRQGWRLDIAGEGSQRQALTSLVAELGIGDHVRFLGQRSDLPDLMRSSSILLAPCPVEGLGLTVLEAMAVGLPVVAAAAGGHLETVGEVPGAALFAPDDAAQAAEHLRRLAFDEADRTAYGDALRDLQQQRFTIPAQAQQTIDFYEGLS